MEQQQADTPITPQMLEQFVAGNLNEADIERVLAHLAENDNSLELVDTLWSRQPLTAVPDDGRLSEPVARQLERRILKQIHRTELTANMVVLGLRGFVEVAAGMLRPFLNPRPQPGRRRQL